MAYQAWSVVAFEQPTVAKWNILGSNDLYFNSMLSSNGILNGQLVRTVTSNNLKIEIKTLSGADPSVANPVSVVIAGVMRLITSALSLTINAGTNWFGSGGVLFATYEIDYFIYVGYKASDSTMFLGMARIPYGRLFSDFSATNTNEKYLAASATPASTDSLVVIGRINNTLSGTASFNWSVPAVSIIINSPIYETRELVYLPTIIPDTGALTSYTSNGHYMVIQRAFYARISFVLTNIGTGTGAANSLLPFEHAGDQTSVLPGREYALTGKMIQAIANVSKGPNTIRICAYDNTNVIVNNYGITVSGFVSMS